MDDGSSKPPLIQLLILLCFSAYLAFAETAFASVSRNRLKVASDRGDSRAKRALWIVDNLEKAITTLLICNNLNSLTVATIVTVYVTKNWGLRFVALSTALTTIVIFFACEMLPKTIAKRCSFKISLSCAGLLCLLMHILKPFACTLSFIGKKASNLTEGDEEDSVTEDEIQDIIEDMAEEGTLDETQSDLISSAMQFGDIRAKDILTPRVDISAIDIDSKPEEILNIIKTQTHSRVPVYKDSIDNIIGVIGIRKYMKAFIKTNKAPAVKPLIDRVYCVHQNTKIHEILPLMSKKKVNMAVVKDKYGGTLGILTVEDILEELVGDIWDESDVISENTTDKTTNDKQAKTEFLDANIEETEAEND